MLISRSSTDTIQAHTQHKIVCWMTEIGKSERMNEILKIPFCSSPCAYLPAMCLLAIVIMTKRYWAYLSWVLHPPGELMICQDFCQKLSVFPKPSLTKLLCLLKYNILNKYVHIILFVNYFIMHTFRIIFESFNPIHERKKLLQNMSLS